MNAKGAINALTKVTSREDDNGFCRTAIQTEAGEVHSIDVLTPRGELFCRLNIAVPREEGDWGNVDVIWNEEQEGMVKAWNKGTPVLDASLSQCSLVGVNIRKKRP